MEYTRKCPKCNREIFHRTERALYLASWRNSLCRSCSQKGHKVSKEARKKMALAKIGKFLSKEHAHKISVSHKGEKHPMWGKHHTEEMKRKSSISHKGQKPTEETKRKLRIKAIEQHKKNGISFPAIDKGATNYFNNLNENEGFHIQHPNIEIKDLGYFVDGYDPMLHAIFEYDTKIHNNRKYKEKDLQRQWEIIKYYESIGNPLSHFFRIKSEENLMRDIFIECKPNSQ